MRADDRGSGTPAGEPDVVVRSVARTDALSESLFLRHASVLRRLRHSHLLAPLAAMVEPSGALVTRTERMRADDSAPASWPDAYRLIVRPFTEALALLHLHRIDHGGLTEADVAAGEGGLVLAQSTFAWLDARARSDERADEETLPPEPPQAVPFVRDVYSAAALLRRRLVGIDVPDAVKEIFDACVHPDLLRRPASGVELAFRLEKAVFGSPAEGGAAGPYRLELTLSARQQLGEVRDDARCAAIVREDLHGPTRVRYPVDYETGEVDPTLLLLYGRRRRFSLRPDEERGVFVVSAAPRIDVDSDSETAARTAAAKVPADVEWLIIPSAGVPATEEEDLPPPPAPVAVSAAVRRLMALPVDELPAKQGGETGDELDTWLRVLDARDEIARGARAPLSFESALRDGFRTTFVLAGVADDDLLGTQWEVARPGLGRRFGNGEVVEQTEGSITLRFESRSQPVPSSGLLYPYDHASAVSLGRQRSALRSIQDATAVNPDLRRIVIDPSSAIEPQQVDVASWTVALDPAKQGAVRAALGTAAVSVVHGPPGTGKTMFILETVLQLLARDPDARILIASQTHVAVDNVIERLRDAGVRSIIRLTGVDDSVVQTSVRDLLLSKQLPQWLHGVKEKARVAQEYEAASHGATLAQALAAIALQDSISVSKRVTELSEQGDQLESSGEGPAADRLRSDADQAAALRRDLLRRAHEKLAGDLDIPQDLSAEDAADAVEAVLGSRSVDLDRIRLQEAWLERLGGEEGMEGPLIAGASIVAGTCTGFVRHAEARIQEFDYCIIDEASRATLTETLIPMSRARRTILVGDTHQLPPQEELLRSRQTMRAHGLREEDVSETLFQRLVDRLPTACQASLDTQYRMVPAIGGLISTCFYDGALRSAGPLEGLPGYEKMMGSPVVWIDTAASGPARREQPVPAGRDGGGVSYRNREEAVLVLDHLRAVERSCELGLISTAGRRLSVLVIAPYAGQVGELRRRLVARRFRHLDVVVMTVDAVQGREADIAVVSLTRSNAESRLGFLSAAFWRRINVALSRARFGLTIVGDADFVRSTDGALRSVLEYIETHPEDCRVRRADDG